MNFKVNFSEQSEGFPTRFGEVQNVGTIDHELLTNRCIPDQHCIGSITGLEEALAEKLPASSFVFGTTDGTVYEGSAGAKNAEDIAFVKQVLIETGTITKIEVEQAYTSRVTADGQNIVDGQKTPVTMIKGSTVRCENLIPFPYKGNVKNVGDTFVKNGLTYKVNADGSITVNGTSTARGDCNLFPMNDSFTIPIGTYTISGCPQGVTQSVGQFQFIVKYADGTTNDTFLGANQLKTIEITQEVVGVYVNIVTLSGQTMNNITFKPMLNVGSTALPYQPYFTDLKHAKIDSIVSTGRNLIPYPYNETTKTMNGITFTDNGDGSITVNGTATGSAYLFLATSSKIKLSAGQYTISGNKTGVIINANKNGAWWGQNGTLTAEDGDVFGNLTVYVESGSTINNVTIYPMFNRGSTALPYEPYTKETYQLPETLELPEWDRFNPQTGEIIRGTSGQLILTGEEAWGARVTRSEAEGTLYRNYIRLSSIAPSNARALQAVSNLYNGVTAEDTYYRVTGVSANDKYIDVYDQEFATNDVSLWKQHLKDLYAAGTPLIVEYKLATPAIEKLEYAPKSYPVYNQGNETAVLENAEFGAIPTITNEYFKVKV